MKRIVVLFGCEGHSKAEQAVRTLGGRRGDSDSRESPIVLRVTRDATKKNASDRGASRSCARRGASCAAASSQSGTRSRPRLVCRRRIRVHCFADAEHGAHRRGEGARGVPSSRRACSRCAATSAAQVICCAMSRLIDAAAKNLAAFRVLDDDARCLCSRPGDKISASRDVRDVRASAPVATIICMLSSSTRPVVDPSAPPPSVTPLQLKTHTHTERARA